MPRQGSGLVGNSKEPGMAAAECVSWGNGSRNWVMRVESSRIWVMPVGRGWLSVFRILSLWVLRSAGRY